MFAGSAEPGTVAWHGNQRHPLVIGLVALRGTYGQTAIGMLPVMVTAWVEEAAPSVTVMVKTSATDWPLARKSRLASAMV